MCASRQARDEKLQALTTVLPAFFADAEVEQVSSEFMQLADKLLLQCGREDAEYARIRLQEIGRSVGVGVRTSS